MKSALLAVAFFSWPTLLSGTALAGQQILFNCTNLSDRDGNSKPTPYTYKIMFDNDYNQGERLLAVIDPRGTGSEPLELSIDANPSVSTEKYDEFNVAPGILRGYAFKVRFYKDGKSAVLFVNDDHENCTP